MYALSEIRFWSEEKNVLLLQLSYVIVGSIDSQKLFWITGANAFSSEFHFVSLFLQKVASTESTHLALMSYSYQRIMLLVWDVVCLNLCITICASGLEITAAKGISVHTFIKSVIKEEGFKSNFKALETWVTKSLYLRAQLWRWQGLWVYLSKRSMSPLFIEHLIKQFKLIKVLYIKYNINTMIFTFRKDNKRQ